MSSFLLRAVAAATFLLSTTALPIDDQRYTSEGPRTGWIYSCASHLNGMGPPGTGPWLDDANGTWNAQAKPHVAGSVVWQSQLSITVAGARRIIRGNGLPSHATGVYPVSPGDPAFAYDRNPNSIRAQSVAYSLPLHPVVAASPACLPMGPIGIMLTGAQLYDALDALGRDAAAHEVLDACAGHPDPSGTYHYHTFSPCMSDPGTGHSNLVGYALDGFGIYGPRGEGGRRLTSADLDECHGHTHAIWWDGKVVVMYHYHMTDDYPYSLGCFRGSE